VGINLFPDRKVCSFDCPYCEVFPFVSDIRFSLAVMEEALRSALAEAPEQGIPVRDICFSGNGEPTLSPHFREALKAAARIRDRTVPEAALVVITNGTGLLKDDTRTFLQEAALSFGKLNIWLKLDAGTPAWYKKMDRSAVPFDTLIECIRNFTAFAPVTIQTMICAMNGKEPPPEEEAAWVRLVRELAGHGGENNAARNSNTALSNSITAGIQAVQIYGKARPAPEDPLTEALPRAVLEKRAELLRPFLDPAIRVEVFP
jgi:histidinol dehydrogenase